MNERGMPSPSHFRTQSMNLWQAFDGKAHLTAQQVLVKGALEADVRPALIAAPDTDQFNTLREIANDDDAIAALITNETNLVVSGSARRTLTLAQRCAKLFGAAIAVLDQSSVEYSVEALKLYFSNGIGRIHAQCLIIEHTSQNFLTFLLDGNGGAGDVPILCPADLDQLRLSIANGLRLSSSSRSPAIIHVHPQLMRSSDTLELFPNRATTADANILRRRRRTRPSDQSDVMRSIRRMEMNRTVGLPSPGERVAAGFITTGITTPALTHLTYVLGLTGRIPMLQLLVTRPVDGSIVERMLLRCDKVIVLDPHPGDLEADILSIAERLRAAGERPAHIFCRTLPSDSDGKVAQLEAGDAIHPSRLARRIVHILHMIRPTAGVAAKLAPLPAIDDMKLPPRSDEAGTRRAEHELKLLIAEVDQHLRDQHLGEGQVDTAPVRLVSADHVRQDRNDAITYEIWPSDRFVTTSRQDIIETMEADGMTYLFVHDVAADRSSYVRHIAAGIRAGSGKQDIHVHSLSLSSRSRFVEAVIRQSVYREPAIFIVEDDPGQPLNRQAQVAVLAEIDRRGYETTEHISAAVDSIISMRGSDETSQSLSPSPVRLALRKDVKSRSRINVRLKHEHVAVVRSRPPRIAHHGESRRSLPRPALKHADRSAWRVHVAGTRGASPGAVAGALAIAGRAMGYHVQSCWHDEPIADGLCAWAEVLYSRELSSGTSQPLSPQCPYGEADLLLGVNVTETLRSICASMKLRVAGRDETCVVAQHTGSNQFEETEQSRDTQSIERTIAHVSRAEFNVIGDFLGVSREVFRTTRVADFIMLGQAYQRGLIPLSIESIERGLDWAEHAGFGRSQDAFEYGRWMAADNANIRPSADALDARPEDVLRETIHLVHVDRWGGAGTASALHHLLDTALSTMPGLKETEGGRKALIDLIAGTHRCALWGGVSLAESYVRLITKLYDADRGERGRALARYAVLPLAEILTVHDPFYISSMLTSTQHLQSIRNALHCKPANGDQIERRVLATIDASLLRHRLQVDLWLNDWQLVALARLRRFIPSRLRAGRIARKLQSEFIAMIDRACIELQHDYDVWEHRLRSLHLRACNGDMQDMTSAELAVFLDFDLANRTADSRLATNNQEPIESQAL